MTSPPNSLRQFTDAAAGAVARAIAGIQKDAQRERELRDAEHRARLAELDTRILAVADLERQVTARLTTLKDGQPGNDGKDGRDGVDGALGKDGTNGADGTSVTLEGCEPLIKAEIARVAAEVAQSITDGWEKPKDGRSVTVEELAPSIEGAVQRAVSALPRPKDGADGKDGTDGNDGTNGQDGADGKMPIVKEWSDKVHYETDVVVHEGSTFQALRDTAKAPPHEDWICIARAGKAGRGFTHRGLFDASAEYAELDVAMLNGASFVSRVDRPGPCPGDGWFLLASQGKQGKPGPAIKGDKGPAGPTITSMSVNDDGLLAVTNADGSVVTCDLYPLLAKLQN